jgi:hypothetical protein
MHVLMRLRMGCFVALAAVLFGGAPFARAAELHRLQVELSPSPDPHTTCRDFGNGV